MSFDSIIWHISARINANNWPEKSVKTIFDERFCAHDGFQCGYCTPGQIMSAVGLIAEGHTTSKEEIREFMSGNICRCGAYPNIVAAICTVLEGNTHEAI